MPVLPGSRYQLTDVINITDPITGNVTQPPYMDIRPRVTATANDDQFVIPDDANNTWPNIALNFLGDAKSWWVIADLSGVVDAFSDLDTAVANSTQLRVPSIQRYLFKILATQQTNS